MTIDNFMPAVGATGIVISGLGFGAATSDGCAGGVARYISSRRIYVPANFQHSATTSSGGIYEPSPT